MKLQMNDLTPHNTEKIAGGSTFAQIDGMPRDDSLIIVVDICASKGPRLALDKATPL